MLVIPLFILVVCKSKRAFARLNVSKEVHLVLQITLKTVIVMR